MSTTQRALQDHERIIADLRIVTDRAGRRLSRELYEQHRDHGMYSVAEIVRRAGSWTAAIAALEAGPTVIPVTGIARPNLRISDEAALAHVKEVADRLGVQHLTATDYNKHRDPGSLQSGALAFRFGTWKNARELAGLDREGARKTAVSDEAALAHVKEVADRLGVQHLTMKAYGEHRDPQSLTPHGLRGRFGSWARVHTLAGLTRGGRPTETVLDDLRAAAHAAGTFPSLRLVDYEDHARPGSIMYSGLRRRFGSWGAVCEMAGLSTTSRTLDLDLPSEDEALNALAEVSTALGATALTEAVYEQNRGDRPGSSKVRKVFGSWTEAARRAGLEYERKAGRAARSTELILDDLRDVADRLGTTSLSKADYDAHRRPGALAHDQLVKRFPSWAYLLGEAGLSTSHRKVTREEVAASIAATARALATTGLSAGTYEAHREPGSPSKDVVLGMFGTWAAACREAGVGPVAVPVSGDEEAKSRVAADLRDVADSLGVTTLTSRAYNAARKDGMLPATTVRHRFGTWAAACEAAGLVPANQSRPATEPDDSTIAGMKEVAARLGATVLTRSTYDESRDQDRHLNSHAVVRRFGSWAAACEAAGLNPGVLTGRRVQRDGTRDGTTDRELLAGLRQVADHLGVDTLTRAVYDEARDRPRHASSKYVSQRFGSWVAACRAARLSSGSSRRRSFTA